MQLTMPLFGNLLYPPCNCCWGAPGRTLQASHSNVASKQPDQQPTMPCGHMKAAEYAASILLRYSHGWHTSIAATRVDFHIATANI